MKLNKIIFGSLMAFSLIAVQSCDKLEDFKDINRNPNATTEPIPAALLTNVLAGIDGHVWGNGINISGGLFCQYFSETQYTEASRYTKPVFNMDGFYAGAMYDLQNIINYSGSTVNQIAAARVLKAYYFWVLTDSYGDIPYANALKGDGNLTYDKQSDIYPALIAELKQAVDQFSASSSLAGDVLYNGNITRWRKFANSMRALIALRMQRVSTSAQTEFEAAVNHSAGVIQDNADNASLIAPGGVYNHPLYDYYNITQRDDYAVAKTVTDFLSANNDPRIGAFGSSNTGFPYGLTRDNAVAFATANPNYARLLHPSQRTANSPINIITASQVYLARAEAAQRGWNAGGTMTNLYSLGIQRSWEEWSVYNAATFATYLTLPAIDLATSPLTKIQTQQWLAFYPNGSQGWANWRRTGVPALTAAPGAGLPIIRRIPYGPNDYNFNLTNVQVAAALYSVGGTADSQDGKVWWDN